MSFYLELRIWPNVIYGTASNFVQIFEKNSDGHYGNDETRVRGRKYEQYMESPNSPKPKKGETGKEQSQEHHLIRHLS
jgi:hypothetical protein